MRVCGKFAGLSGDQFYFKSGLSGVFGTLEALTNMTDKGSRMANAKHISEDMLATLRASEFWKTVSVGLGCWAWTGALNQKGYGRFFHRGQSFGAHRIAFALGKNTALPGSIFICHRCDNPACVNPDHLFLGTANDNNQDMKAKGRAKGPTGLSNGRGKLSDQDIADIRASAKRQVDLCREYGVSDGHMSRIISGKKRPGSDGPNA